MLVCEMYSSLLINFCFLAVFCSLMYQSKGSCHRTVVYSWFLHGYVVYSWLCGLLIALWFALLSMVLIYHV